MTTNGKKGTLSVALIATDSKGVKTTIELTFDKVTPKGTFNRHQIKTNSLGIVGTVYLPAK